ncbi:Aste57867_9982 [Aphanomyces stellatus]|uniref:Aste57867_9982 protein n=1 Tax=Aphanomyces stellatus TaxID=120398 RepID=A0A485KPI4_9STRA|nr:hypothetical protein As57867_009943 [Aphanomyces stellatus]VFT86860.1 Aste57867_9982 [Aphanomyces stellatus]
MASSFEVTESSFVNARDLKIYTRKYIPRDSYSIVLLFLHGIGEHCSRYDASFSTLATEGIAVYAMDHQGHGRSDGARFDCGHFSEFIEDILAFNDILRADHASHPGVKIIVSGISFGGLLAAVTAATQPRQFDGLLLYAPAIGIEMTWTLWVQNLFAGVLEALIPSWQVVPAVNVALLSRNTAFVEDYVTDPLNDHSNLRVRLALSVKRGMDHLAKIKDSIRMPVLVFHGDLDRVTSPEISKAFFDALATPSKTYTSLKGQWHCLLNEPEAGGTMAASLDWLKARAKL